MLPGVYNFSSLVQGDTYPETILRFRDDNEVPVNFTDCSVEISFQRQSDCKSIPVSITDPIGGVVTIPAFAPDWSVGKWDYQLKITTQAGEVQTYLAGTIQILRSIECP